MLKKIVKLISSIMGIAIGYIVGKVLITLGITQGIKVFVEPLYTGLILLIVILIFAIIFYFLSSFIYKGIIAIIDGFERNIQKLTVTEFLFGTLGLLVGLVFATLIGVPISRIHFVIGPILFILIDLIGALVGIKIFIKRKDDILNLLTSIKKNGIRDKKNKHNEKIWDTSVIIDGRIFDICQTGFVEGPLVIPGFVLNELRHISDSADGLKRNRGRRGLDILNKIQKELSIETQIYEEDFPEIAEVDAKLLKLAQVLNGKVVTNDFNLNKVAEFQGVPVLNINELANAIKPVLLPGEEMKVVVMKDGKEASQGIAYLDDGTMIVVEGGRKFISEEIMVVVTSVLQTAAGRMIFAKPKES